MMVVVMMKLVQKPEENSISTKDIGDGAEKNTGVTMLRATNYSTLVTEHSVSSQQKN